MTCAICGGRLGRQYIGINDVTRGQKGQARREEWCPPCFRQLREAGSKILAPQHVPPLERVSTSALGEDE